MSIGLNTIDFVYESLLSYEMNSSPANLNRLKKECHQNLRNKKVSPSLTPKNYLSYAQKFMDKRNDNKTHMIEKMLNYNAVCKIAGFDINASIVYGGGGGFRMGTCKTNLGNTFFAWIPVINKLVGFGADLMLSASEVRYQYREAEFSPELFTARGIIAAYEETQDGVSAVGIGLNAMLGGRWGKVIKLIPLKSDYTELLKIYTIK